MWKSGVATGFRQIITLRKRHLRIQKVLRKGVKKYVAAEVGV